MRLVLGVRTQRLMRRLPDGVHYRLIELFLLAILVGLAARLLWIALTPLGTKPYMHAFSYTTPQTLTDFDPFFRLSDADATTLVTGINLKLYGIRQDRASGRGAAIIGPPGGVQASYSVGETVTPGITLAAVGFDNVILKHDGKQELLFLDQSRPTGVANPLPCRYCPSIANGGDR